MDSVAKKAELWLIDEESTARFSQRLMSSPLAQRTVHNIKNLLLTAVYLVEEYFDDDERASIQLLLDIAKTSSKSEGVSRDKCGMGLDFYIQELNLLEIGARTATRVIGDLFERVFLSLTSTRTTWIPSQTTRTLNRVVTNLDTQLFWLGEILQDLGNLIAIKAEGEAKEIQGKPLNYLNEVRKKRNQSRS